MVVYQALDKGDILFCFNKTLLLSDDDKAAAINLALFLDVRACDKRLLNIISKRLKGKKGRAVYELWRTLSPDTQRVYLCMMDFLGRI